MTGSSVVLFILLGCFCLIRADREGALHRFRTTVVKVQTANKLLELLQKNKINCETYEVYCSQIIENSPSLKLHPEVYQQSCETKLRPHVCNETATAINSVNTTIATTTTP